MPDIKTRPMMDGPKIRPQSSAPRDAASLLRQHYEEEQRTHRPAEQGAVQFATDQAEAAGYRGAMGLSKEIRRGGSYIGRSLRQPTVSREVPFTDTCQDKQRPLNREQERRFLRHRKQGIPTTGSRAAADRPPRRELVSLRADGDTLPSSHVFQEWKRRRTYHLAEKKHQGNIFRAHGNHGGLPSGKNTPKAVQSHSVRSRAVFSSTGRAAAKKARQAAQRKAQKKMLAQTAKQAQQAAKASARLSSQIITAAGRTVAAAVSALAAAGGGAVLLVLLLALGVVAALAASPFGILFAGDNISEEAVSVPSAMAQIQSRLSQRLEDLQTEEAYHEITLSGSLPDWTEVLAVFAVKTAGGENGDGIDVTTMDADRIARLETVFTDMCSVSHTVKVREHPDSDPDDGIDDSWTEMILHLDISAKTAEEMKTAYRFTAQQISMLDELLSYGDTLSEMIYDLSFVNSEAAEVIEYLPEDLPEDRRAVVSAACSLVGKVNYFWGGKSLTIGWDEQWGQLRRVTAAGSPTSGLFRPYGLDCSGFVDWVFYNASGGSYVIGHGGGARAQHDCCEEVAWEEALPGDLVFYPEDEHVGIVAGKNREGQLLVIHCASGQNNVVITTEEGFSVVGRPKCVAYY